MPTPFSLTSYTQKLVQDQQAQSIGDVLRNDPGVRIARGFGNYQELYVIRGFAVNSDDLAYNGLNPVTRVRALNRVMPIGVGSGADRAASPPA